MNNAKYTMHPVAPNNTQTVVLSGRSKPEIPTISHAIRPAIGVARNFLLVYSILWEVFPYQNASTFFPEYEEAISEVSKTLFQGYRNIASSATRF